MTDLFARWQQAQGFADASPDNAALAAAAAGARSLYERGTTPAIRLADAVENLAAKKPSLDTVLLSRDATPASLATASQELDDLSRAVEQRRREAAAAPAVRQIVLPPRLPAGATDEKSSVSSSLGTLALVTSPLWIFWLWRKLGR